MINNRGTRQPFRRGRPGFEDPQEENLGIVASVSEPHLPLTANDDLNGSNSPYTAIPDAFYRRRAGITKLSRSTSESAAKSGGSVPRDASFEVEHYGDIKAVDSRWIDDDVEEVMVVHKRDKKRKPLSVIVEATEGPSCLPLKLKDKDKVSVDANRFDYIRNIGVQGARESLLARNSDDGRVYTVKLVRKLGHDAARLSIRIRKEKSVLKALTIHDAPYVVRLWWSFEDERAMYIVTDRTDGRNLKCLIEEEGPLAGREALICAAQLAAGICSLHELGIVHTSLRPSSVLIGLEGHIVISEFDNVQVLHGDIVPSVLPRIPSVANSEDIQYRAPEIVLGWQYDYAVDWWSFGLLFFWLLARSHPFLDEDHAAPAIVVRSQILYADLPANHLGMDEKAYDLVVRCLQHNSALRIDGLRVKMHEYFREVNWDDIGAKRMQAPFPPSNPHACPIPGKFSDPRSPHMVPPNGDLEPFLFDWQHDLPSGYPLDALALSRVRHSLHTLRMDEDRSGDEPLLPACQGATIPPVCEVAAYESINIPLRVPESLPSEQAHDPDITVLSDLAMTRLAGLPTPPNSRIGNLRKYSSLNFDDVDSIDSATSTDDAAEPSAGRPLRSHSSALLRKSKSILGISLESLRDKDVDDTSNHGSVRWTKKLRRRPRPEGPVPPTPPVPTPELPRGIERIGAGIGYTYRGTPRRPTLNLASLTPRTCHGIFTGRRSKSGAKGKDKDEVRAGSGWEATHEGQGHEHAGGEAENEEDLMDEVMREIYGEEWNAGVSPDPGVVRFAGPGEGVGWGDVLARGRFGMAEDASFAGPDVTLRLVTSPSTPRLDP